MFDLLDEPEMEADPLPDKAAKLPGRVEGRVSFEHVRFGYSPDKPLMRDVSFTAEPGQKIAVVGTTGAGKTTLINLLMRFYEIDGGRITLDGVDTSRMDRGELRQQFGMVLQDAWLFGWHDCRKTSPTAVPRRRATEIVGRHSCRAGRLLCAHHAAGLRHAGGPTMPRRASARGQRQLLTIARVLLNRGADSHPDARRRRAWIRVPKACHRPRHERAHARGVTSFVIAHRLSTIVDADLDSGHGSRQHYRAGVRIRSCWLPRGAYADPYLSQFA